MPDGRVAFIDFGMTKHLDTDQIELEIAALEAVFDDDAEGLRVALHDLGFLNDPRKVDAELLCGRHRRSFRRGGSGPPASRGGGDVKVRRVLVAASLAALPFGFAPLADAAPTSAAADMVGTVKIDPRATFRHHPAELAANAGAQKTVARRNGAEHLPYQAGPYPTADA